MSKIALNTRAPDFSLKDFQGKTFRLSELCGNRNVVLVFNRGFV